MKKTSIVMAVIILLPLSFAGITPQNGQDLFQKALAKERAEGNLDGAIELYKRIIQNFAGDRALAAKALIQLGKCYEKLGKSEARNAYSRVLQDYGDQSQQVEEARARLASLGSAGSEPRLGAADGENTGLTFRKIEIPKQKISTHLARLSPDGKKMICLDEPDKKAGYGLYVVDLSSGQRKALVEDVQAQTYIFFEWSPDGKKIVYKHGRSEIRAIDSDGGEPKTLWSSADSKESVYLFDWSQDGRSILLGIANETDGVAQMAILDSSGGEPRIVLAGKYDEFDNYPQFSPDGASIVGQRTKGGNTDVYVWTVDGKQEIRLTEHPAIDSQPFWSPDGKSIVFMSDREKTEDLWAIPMQGIQPAGAPVRIKRNLGKNTRLTDFTANGTLTMFMFSEGMSDDLFVLSVDPLTGEAQGRFLPFAKYPTPFPGSWSPDGKRMAYTSRKGDIRLPGIFIGQGGEQEDEEIPVPNYFVANIEWSGDGQSLVFPGWDPERRLGIFRVSLKDFKVEPVLPVGQTSPGLAGAFVVNLRWLPRAKVFSFDKLDGKNKCREVYQMDSEGRNVRLMTDRIIADVWTCPSPDGRCLAYLEARELKLWSLEENKFLTTLVQFPEGQPYEGPAWSPEGLHIAWKDKKQLKVFSLRESTSRVLAEAGENSEIGGVPYFGGLAWSPDGRAIAYVLQIISTGSKPRSEVWTVPASGGAPRKISDAPASHPVLGPLAWHPSGKMILASGKTPGSESRMFEHWALENFLPKPKAGK